jgi:hypothetical protein
LGTIINGSGDGIPTRAARVPFEDEKYRRFHDKIAAKIRARIARINLIEAEWAKA